MDYKYIAYSEIIKNFANFFSSAAVAIFSFISVAWIVALSIPGDRITFGGYELQVNPTFTLAAIALSFTFLIQSSLILSLLFFLKKENGN